MSYRPYTIALDVASPDKQEIIPLGQTISEVAILTMPTGVSIKLAFGDNPGITIDKPVTFEPKGDDVQNRGLYYINETAHARVTVEIVIATGGVLYAQT